MSLQNIQSKIYEIRGLKVMFDFDLAVLYEVETRVLNQAVKRNIDLFPKDFMIILSSTEWKSMSSQIVMTSPWKRPKRSIPIAFTEHGVAMLASVLKSKKARETSIAIIRAFIHLKQFILSYKELSDKIKHIEIKYNQHFTDILEVLNYLLEKDTLEESQKDRKKIGY